MILLRHYGCVKYVIPATILCRFVHTGGLERRRALASSQVARLPRSTFPGYGVWHATTRGVERRQVYLDRNDGRDFLIQLWRAVDRFQLDVHALCLMPNHYHFVVECSRDVLSRALHRVNGLYAAAFNAKYGRSGHLWGDRFALWQVRDEEHLETTCAYVLANPVRAGLCSSADDWPWSWCATRVARRA